MQTKNIIAFGTAAAETPLKEMTIQRRALTPHDVQIEILYCGICHSDLHQVKNDFESGCRTGVAKLRRDDLIKTAMTINVQVVDPSL